MASTTLLEAPTPPPDALKEERGLNHLAFNRLLQWLDHGVDSRGERYLEMRRRLVSYFNRRNRQSSDELADETFNRIGRILEKDGTIAATPPARYCYTVAKFVFLEDVRRDRTHVSFDQSLAADGWAWRATSAEPDEGFTIREQHFECLDRWLQELKAEQREFIVEYYRDSGRQKIERHRDMAKRLGITMNALGLRALRIRSALEERVEACCSERQQIR
jgi:DNA-directed RNA polymerase specialized sigma24 family protein